MYDMSRSHIRYKSAINKTDMQEKDTKEIEGSLISILPF